PVSCGAAAGTVPGAVATWFSAMCATARTRSLPLPVAILRTYLKTGLSFNLHVARLSPRFEKEKRPNQRQHQGRFPNGRPASAAHERVTRQLDEIARGDEGGNPTDARRNIRDRKNKPR